MRLLKSVLTFHPLLTFFVMGAAAVAFGLFSFNLFSFFQADLALIRENGAMALADGAMAQLFELFLCGAAALAAYLVFKACEKILVERLLK